MRILGIDYGRARIGVALGDTETRVASPWRVVDRENDEEAVARIGEIAKQERAEKVVIGIPTPLGDPSRETDQAREIREFAVKLKSLGLPIEEENETLTSALAKMQAAEMGETKKRDDLAASAILQMYLDKMSNVQ